MILSRACSNGSVAWFLFKKIGKISLSSIKILCHHINFHEIPLSEEISYFSWVRILRFLVGRMCPSLVFSCTTFPSKWLCGRVTKLRDAWIWDVGTKISRCPNQIKKKPPIEKSQVEISLILLCGRNYFRLIRTYRYTSFAQQIN